MLSTEYYRRALATLAKTDYLHVSLRSVRYSLLEHCPQCVIMRRYVHFQAPDRIRSTTFDCNPVAVPDRTNFIQVGDRAYSCRRTISDGAWKEHKVSLAGRDGLPAILARWAELPGTDPFFGGVFHVINFQIPVSSAITLDGHERQVFLLPVETQLFPRLDFPGDPIPSGPRISVRYRGEQHRPQSMKALGQLFVDARTAQPQRYRSTTTATILDDVTVVLERTHVRFRYATEPVIELPV